MTAALNGFMGANASAEGAQRADAGLLAGLHTVAGTGSDDTAGNNATPFPDLVAQMLAGARGPAPQSVQEVTTSETEGGVPTVSRLITGRTGDVESDGELSSVAVSQSAGDEESIDAAEQQRLMDGQWFGLFGHLNPNRLEASPSAQESTSAANLVADGSRPADPSHVAGKSGSIELPLLHQRSDAPIPGTEDAKRSASQATDGSVNQDEQISGASDQSTGQATGEHGSTSFDNPAHSNTISHRRRELNVPATSPKTTVSEQSHVEADADTASVESGKSTRVAESEATLTRPTSVESLTSSQREPSRQGTRSELGGSPLGVPVTANPSQETANVEPLLEASTEASVEGASEVAPTTEAEMSSQGDGEQANAEPQGQLSGLSEMGGRNTPTQPTAFRQVISAQVASAIVDQGIVQQDEGATVLRVKLDPPELGEIMLRLQRRADGEVTVEMHARDAQTAQLVGEGVPEIRSALEQAGIETGEMSVTHQEGDFGNSGDPSTPQQERYDEDNDQTPGARKTQDKSAIHSRQGVRA